MSLPEVICNNCLADLNVAYKFRSKCEESAKILQSIVQSSEFEEIPPENSITSNSSMKICDEETNDNKNEIFYEDEQSIVDDDIDQDTSVKVEYNHDDQEKEEEAEEEYMFFEDDDEISNPPFVSISLKFIHFLFSIGLYYYLLIVIPIVYLFIYYFFYQLECRRRTANFTRSYTVWWGC